MDDEHRISEGMDFFLQKKESAYHLYRKNMHFGMFKLIETQPDPRNFLWIEVTIDANSMLNFYSDKYKINYKKWKKKRTYLRRIDLINS